MWSIKQLLGKSVRRRVFRSHSLRPLQLCVNVASPADGHFDTLFCCDTLSSTLTARSIQRSSFSSKAALPPKKKKPTYANVKADEGRVVLIQSSHGKKTKNNAPRLCTGCGTEVLFGKDVGVTAGLEAVDSERSKKQKRASRFVDAMDGQDYVRKSDTVQTGFLCDRCKHLRSDNVWKAYDALNDVDASVFAKQLSYVVHRRRFGMCILVVDATDPEHSAMKGLRKSIGKTPCWLVFNKIDLLPRFHDGDLRALRGRVEHIVGTKFVSCHAVSAILESGIVALAEQMLGHLGGRDVFVVGAANVGKTTLVQCLSSCIANAVKLVGKSYQKRREIANNLAATGSHLPGTTLQAIRIPCFRKMGHALWDTPGIINRKAIQYSIFPTHLMEPLSRPLAIPFPDDLRKLRVRPGYSILVEAGWMHKSFLDNKETYKNLMRFKSQPGEEPEQPVLDEDVDLFEGWSDEEDDDDDKEDNESTNNEERRSLPNREQRPLSYERSHPTGPEDSLGPPTVLGRIDVTRAQENSVYVQAFLHPTLNVRIVPTHEAPDRAIIPKDYIQYVEEKMGRKVKSSSSMEKPLLAYLVPNNPKGEIQPTEKDENQGTGRVFMDISFASLGWLAFAHANTDFTLIPHCVEGSVYSKRRSLYPLNVQDFVASEQYDKLVRDDLESEETKQRLRRAADVGKCAQGGSGKKQQRHDNSSFGRSEWDGGDGDGDEWF